MITHITVVISARCRRAGASCELPDGVCKPPSLWRFPSQFARVRSFGIPRSSSTGVVECGMPVWLGGGHGGGGETELALGEYFPFGTMMMMVN